MSEIINVEAVQEENFAELLEQSIKTLNTGDKVLGTVTGIGNTEIQVDLGTKHAGYIPYDEVSADPSVKPEDILHVGDEIEVFVVRVNAPPYRHGHGGDGKPAHDPDKICVGKTKTDEERTVPISQGLYALLMTHKHEQQKKHGVLFPNAFIFCSALDPYKPIYPTEPTRWQSKFVKRNNLPKVSPHDLRHTAATLALESGADLKQVQDA